MFIRYLISQLWTTSDEMNFSTIFKHNCLDLLEGIQHHSILLYRGTPSTENIVNFIKNGKRTWKSGWKFSQYSESPFSYHEYAGCFKTNTKSLLLVEKKNGSSQITSSRIWLPTLCVDNVENVINASTTVVDHS